MSLNRLSAEAVTSMIESEAFDVDAILALTRGNPLFVAEVLASGIDAVPLSVRDAVLARASKLSPGARRVLDLVSVVPGEVEGSLVDQIVGPTGEELAEGVRHGLLRVDDKTLSFLHDLQRRAVEGSLTTSARRSLNQQILDALGDSAEPARLVHHATEANDVGAIMRFAPRAARAAMAIESTTEAVAHFRAAARYVDRLEPEEQAAILFDRAIDLYRAEADTHNLARTLTAASVVNRTFGHQTNSAAYSTEAVELLEPHGPSLDLVRALSHRAFLEFVYTDKDEAVLPLLNRAISVAPPRGSPGPRHRDRQALAERGVRILDVEARTARRSPEGHRRLLRLDHQR